MQSSCTSPIDAPEAIELDGRKWVRSNVCKGTDLTDGEAWMNEFKRMCSEEEQSPSAGAARPRRMLRPVVTDGDEPHFWQRGASRLSPADRNRLLDKMPSCGQQALLPTGEEVIFWFNVGPYPDPSKPREKVFVTSSTCPHQGVPLVGGELREIEDVHGVQRACIRCPRHNKCFDIRTGAGQGCTEVLKTYSVRFIDEFKRFYVDVGEADRTQEDGDADAMDVDETQEPAFKRQCLEESSAGPIKPIPTPVRPTRQLVMSHTAT
mmetsp:Transcript_2456/g.6114  ORF Transcript_2456/g.6114 Transcript_2456/m.6114 type:complete len:264 (+) Transcript_2456:69-860(+)